MGNITSFSIFLMQAMDPDSLQEFDTYAQEYHKNYTDMDEFQEAMNTYYYNKEWIENSPDFYSHNLSINQYMDIHPTTFHNTYKGYINLDKTRSCKPFTSTANSSSLPDSVDWRYQNAVTHVKDQGQCGSCWSFSATGAMEGAWAIRNGHLLNLSEQQLLDCSKYYGDFACNGGEMDSAFRYAIDNGMYSEDDDPYQAKTYECIDCNVQAVFSSCVDVTSNNEMHLKEAVTRGPVSVAIDADTLAFQFYSGGIINNQSCGTNLDHGVLVVGYGEEKGQLYWLVKNSWGSEWGHKGYVKIARLDSESSPGVCGIASQPSYPIADIDLEYNKPNYDL